jgi:hypothetical protein
MATAHLTSTLDRAAWELGITARGRAAGTGHTVRDLKADWRRWSLGERTAVLALAAVWVAAIFAFAAMSGV